MTSRHTIRTTIEVEYVPAGAPADEIELAEPEIEIEFSYHRGSPARGGKRTIVMPY